MTPHPENGLDSDAEESPARNGAARIRQEHPFLSPVGSPLKFDRSAANLLSSVERTDIIASNILYSSSVPDLKRKYPNMRALLLILTLAGVAPGPQAVAIAAEPRQIAEERFITLGGMPQWVTIRGSDRTKPVLLFLHGGPGDAQSSLTSVYKPFERDFVLVQWDQRGAGRTLGHSGAERQQTSLDRLISDGIELAAFIRGYLHTKRVILVGHSWGSYLAVEIVKRRPDLFSAFVGIGQIVNLREAVETQYRYTLARARAEPDLEAVAELEKLGIPAQGNLDQYIVLRGQLNRYLAVSDLQWLSRQDSLIRAQVSADDFRAYQQGLQTMTGLASTVFAIDTPALGFDFKLPVFLIQGTEDHITDSSSAAHYFKDIQAPIKRMTPIEGAGHFAPATHTEQVAEAIRQDMRLVPSSGK